MEEKFFTKDFDFRKYMNEQLLEISDEQTRKEIREAIKHLLIPFYDYAEEGYHQLEQRFRKEEETKKEMYQIRIGICKRAQIDTTDPVMHLMKLEDKEKIQVNSAQIMEAMSKKKSLRLFTVFIEKDVLALNRLLKEKRKYQGTIKTEYGEYQGIFSLKKNTEYLQKIEEVYQVFLKNNQVWRTVPEMYLHKMFDVYFDSGIVPEEEKILDIKIDFQEWNPYVHYDYVPLWNLCCDTYKTSAYPELCIDKINYIHTVFGEKLQQDTEYMVVNTEDMRYAKRQGRDFIIVCDEEKPIAWKLLSFCYGETVYENYEKELFHSGTKQYDKTIRTKGEIRKLIDSLEASRYLKLTEIEKGESLLLEEKETYEMDAFLMDEIRVGENKCNLIFEFVPEDRDFYLNRDIMSYIVSRLQWELPEYHCIGRLK